MYACIHNHIDIVDLLILCRVDLESIDTDYFTALFLSCSNKITVLLKN